MDTQNGMTLTRISSGMTSAFSGRTGTITYGSSVSAVAGYTIAVEESTNGMAYDVLTLYGEEDVEEPATVILEVEYEQSEAFEEVDLEARYKGIPEGTSIEVSSTAEDFSIRKQTLSKTSGLVSAVAMDVEPFKATLVLSLWITNPEGISSDSSVSLDMFSIDGSGGGPTKKTLLGKVELQLS